MRFEWLIYIYGTSYKIKCKDNCGTTTTNISHS